MNTFSLQIGTTFGCGVATGRCVEYVPITVLRGNDRTVLSFPSKSRIAAFDADNWLAGSVPPGIRNVRLMTASSRRMIAAGTIEDGCFYFDLVSKTASILSFEPTPGLTIDVPIDLSTAAAGNGQVINLTSQRVIKDLVDSTSR